MSANSRRLLVSFATKPSFITSGNISMSFELEMAESINQQLFQLALNQKTSLWVDSNVLMYSPRTDKNRLLEFSELRTTPEVVYEVSKRPPKTSGFLDPFLDQAVVVGADSFCVAGDGEVFAKAATCCKLYSPMTRVAIQRNLEANGSNSPIENNLLRDATDDSTIFDQAEANQKISEAISVATDGALSPMRMAAVKKLKKSWLEYHAKREKGIREKTYIWTDELLVASAITDAFANNCVTIVLTNDWDPNVIMKHFIDNVIAAVVDRQTQEPEQWWKLYENRCGEFDHFLASRRQSLTDAICDGDLFAGCIGGDILIWQYPSNGFWPFSFDSQMLDEIRQPEKLSQLPT